MRSALDIVRFVPDILTSRGFAVPAAIGGLGIGKTVGVEIGARHLFRLGIFANKDLRRVKDMVRRMW
jgi:hypothetical protein